MRRRNPEVLELRLLLSATMFEHDDVGYFLSQSSAEIERFDIAAEQWLDPITLESAPGTPTAALVDDNGIFVAYGSQLIRYAPDGSDPLELVGIWGPIIALHTDGNLLFVNYSSGLYARFTSVNLSTNQLIDTFQNYVDSVVGSSIATDVNMIFGRSSGVSPADITFVQYDDDGNLLTGGDSPHHGDYPGASRTWVFPNGSKVVDNSGTIYATSGLTQIASFGSQIDALDFYGADVPIVLRGNTITAYSQSILPTGSATLDSAPATIYVNDENVIAFIADSTDPHGYRVIVTSLDDLEPPQPGTPVNPVGLAYTPDEIALAADGTVLLYSKSHQSVFRWDPATEDYIDTIPLIGTAQYMAYSSELDTIFLAYSNGLIRKIELGQAEPTEVPFALLPGAPTGLAAAGEYLFASDPSGAWGSHYTFDLAGQRISAVDWNYYSRDFVWSDANQRMYFLRDDTSPNDLLWEQINANGTAYPGLAPGEIGQKMDSPLHTSSGFTHPIRVSPDGSVVVLGSGYLHDGLTLARLPYSLAGAVRDAAWIGGKLFTIRDTAGSVQLQEWSSPSYESVQAKYLAGTSIGLLAVPGTKLLAITAGTGGVPKFTLLDEDLLEAGKPGSFQIFETGGDTVVSESGASDTIEVVLSTPPDADVVIDVLNADQGEVAVAPLSLTFTPLNWNVPQLVTLAGVDDSELDGARQTLLTFRVNTALSDPGYQSAAEKFVTVTTLDDETQFAVLGEFAGVAYFFLANQPRVERFDIAAGVWLAPLQLDAPAEPLTAAHVDADGLYVAHGVSVYRYNLDGSNRQHVVNTTSNVVALHTDGNVLFVNFSSGLYARLLSFDKTSLALIDEIENYIDSVYGSSISTSDNRIFGRTSGISPSDITFVSYSDDGHFMGGGDSPYHADYPGATRTWVFPNETKVVDSAGHIYATDNLLHLGNFPSAVDDVTFLGGDVPLVLRDGIVTAYTQAILPTGSLNVSNPAGKVTEILANSSTLFAFHADPTQPSGMSVTTHELADLNPPQPGEPVNPVGLSYTPDNIVPAADGSVLIYSKSHQSIFRWNPTTQGYVESIPLIGTADFMAYAREANVVYLAYNSGLIRKIDLNQPIRQEVPFAVLPAAPMGLQTAGDYLFAVDGSGAWVTHYTIDPAGAIVSAVDWNYYSREFVWSDANQRMYFFRDDTSPNDLLWEQINAAGDAYPGVAPGGIGLKDDSPLHSSSGFSHPIRVAPDGSLVVLGSGYMHDPISLERLPAKLPNTITDAAWIGGSLFTLYKYAGGIAHLQSWAGTTLVDNLELPGEAQSLVSLPGNRLLATTLDGTGVPRFHVVNEQLELIAPAAQIVGRRLFYDASRYDLAPGIDLQDDAAIAIDKVAYIPAAANSAASQEHISSYSRGINGLVIDVLGPHGPLSVADFTFKLGNSNDPSTWANAPAPTGFLVRPGVGPEGSDRIEFIWPDGAIKNTWLRVDVLPGGDLPAETFYFGNLVGETDGLGDSQWTVDLQDSAATLSAIGARLPITTAADHNKDGLVNIADILLVRNSSAAPLIRLNLGAAALDETGPSDPLDLIGPRFGSGVWLLGYGADSRMPRAGLTSVPELLSLPAGNSAESLAPAARIDLNSLIPEEIDVLLELDFVNELAESMAFDGSDEDQIDWELLA